MTDEADPATKRPKLSFAASPATTTTSVSSLSVSETSSVSVSAKANAILSSKPKQTLKKMLQAQISMAVSKREFVLENATTHTIEGYVLLTEESKRLHVAMDAAAEKEDFDAAEEHKIKLERVSKAAEFEHKLYHHCQWAVKHAMKKLDELKKNRLFMEMKEWTPLRDAANEYLQKIPEEDLTRFEINKLTKKSNGTVVSTEAPGGEASLPAPPLPTMTAVEEEVADSAQGTTTEQQITKPKSKSARKRSSKGYTTSNEAEENTGVQEEAKVDSDKKKKSNKNIQKPPSLSAYRLFIGSTSYRVNHPKGGHVFVDVTLECYIMSNGYLYCNCCNKAITWDNRTRHMVAEKHIMNKKTKVDAANSAAAGRAIMQQRIEIDSLVGKTYNDEKCESILMWLKIACKGNWSLRSIEDVKPLLSAVTKCHIPGRREMGDAIPVLHQQHLDKIKTTIAECYPEYTVIMDGTPVFAEAECVMLRFVHMKSKQIVQYVVHLALYAESLDGITIASNLTNALHGLNLNLKKWKATSADRAATNKRAMTIIMEEHNIEPFRAYCISHGTAGCGKKAKMTVGAGVVKHAGAMVKHSLCKARSLFADIFNEAAKKNSGVRWGVYHEVCVQINSVGLIALREEYAQKCSDNNWSKQSADSFLEATNELHDLCIASVEIAAVVDVGQLLVSETYICESDQCGAFTVHEGITELQRLFAQGIVSFDSAGKFVELNRRAEEAAELMSAKYLAPIRTKISDAEKALGHARGRESEAQAAIDDWAHAQVTPDVAVNRNRRNIVRQNYKALNGNAAAILTNNELEEALNGARQEVEERAAVLESAKNELADFCKNHCTTYDDFRECGIAAASPVADDYKRLFIDPKGDYSKIVIANKAARALNPLVAKDMTVLELEEAIIGLREYGFDELRDKVLIEDMAKEIPAYKAAIRSTSESFWSKVDGAKEYDDNVATKKDGDHASWKNDRIEQSRRVWEWWRMKSDNLLYFFTAARLVAIVPLSSASVERVFSQVKLIIEACGVNLMEETLELRVMERVNDL